MSRTRGTALALVVALVGAGVAWGFRDRWTYRHALVTYDDDAGEANRYVDLPDGRARLSLGSPDGHSLVVQWRDPDGHGWTAPDTVYTDASRTAIDSTVREAGGTVAIMETYTSDTGDDEDTWSSPVYLACRDLSCEASDLPGVLDDPSVSADGATALFSTSEESALLWTADDGIHEEPWGSLVPVADPHGPVSFSTVSLMPDGRLRTVRSTLGARCTFSLLLGDAGSTELTEVAEVVRPRRPGSGRSCRSYLLDGPGGSIEVKANERGWPPFWFVPAADGWAAAEERPA